MDNILDSSERTFLHYIVSRTLVVTDLGLGLTSR